MQNITIEKLRAAAARLGFYKRPIDDLIKLIETSVQDQFQAFETKYKMKKEKVSKKLELLTKKRNEIKNKIGETLISSETMLQGLSGIFIFSILFYIGSLEDMITAFLYVGLGICGAFIVHIKPVNSDFWKPILFSILSVMIVIMQTVLLYDRGYSYGQAIIFSIPLGIITYLLNENLFASVYALMDQTAAIWHRLHLVVNRFRSSFNQKLLIKVEKKYEATLKEKERTIKKYISVIKYEYEVAELASTIKHNKINNLKHYQLNGKEHNYAN